MRPATVLALHLRRPSMRGLLVVAVGLGVWQGWSPGTAFGLGGLVGGWRFAAAHVLDAGLVPIVVAAALVASTTRERAVDQQLHAAGTSRGRVLAGVLATGAAVAVVVGLAFAAGAAVGGLTRSVTTGGSWVSTAAGHGSGWWGGVGDLRLALAVALAGVLAASVGWVARRDEAAVAVVALAALVETEQLAPLVGRFDVVVWVRALLPFGALRAAALGDRGLAAAGFGHPTDARPWALVLAAWCAALVLVALPPGRQARRGPATVSRRTVAARRRSPAVAAALAGAVVVTVVAAAVVPGRVAGAVPWRWQRSWRDAQRAGWASPQVVDRLIDSVRSGRGLDTSHELLMGPDAVTPDVVDALVRADSVDRQPERTQAGPGRVLVRLRFDDPVRSGEVAFTAYLVGFTCERGPDGRWRIRRVDGPLAVEGRPLVDAAEGS